jgi:hypothetical protein
MRPLAVGQYVRCLRNNEDESKGPVGRTGFIVEIRQTRKRQVLCEFSMSGWLEGHAGSTKTETASGWWLDVENVEPLELADPEPRPVSQDSIQEYKTLSELSL